jgi:hypothetical protein
MISMILDEELAEQSFQDWFSSHLQPRAAKLGMTNNDNVRFEVIFPPETGNMDSLWYTSEDWKKSVSIIFPDSGCKLRTREA